MGAGKTKKAQNLQFCLESIPTCKVNGGYNYQTVSVLYEYFHSHEIGKDKSYKGPDLYRRKSVMSSDKGLFK